MKFSPKTKLQNLAILGSALLATGGLFALSTVSVSAAANQLYLSPATTSVAKGSSFVVNLRVNPGTAIDTVTASIGYDSSKVTLQSVDCTGSPLSPAPNATIGCPASGNPVSITSAVFGSTISSDSFVAKLTFLAVAGSGSGAITVGGDTAAAGNSLGADTTDAAVTFTTPATVTPTCAAGQTGTYPNCVTPSTGTTGGTSSGGTTKTTTPTTGTTKTTTPTTTKTTPPATVAPASTDNILPTVTGKTLEFSQATFTTTSKAASQEYIQFGTSADSLTQQTAFSTSATSHTLTIDPSLLTPGQTYYYVVVSKGANGAITQTSVDSFKLNGLTIRVSVADIDHKPLTKKVVTLHSTPVTATTDSKGVASFSDVIPGTHQVQYTTGGKTYTQTISVLNNVTTSGATQTAPVQTVSVVYNVASSKSLAGARWVVLGLLLVVVVVAVILFSQRKIRFATPAGAPLKMDSIVVGGSSSSPPTHTKTDTVIATAPKAVETSERLSSIPTPDTPAPGITVAPVSTTEDRKDGGEQL